MEAVEHIVELLREWLPFLITLLFTIFVIAGAYYLLIKRRAPTGGSIVGRQILIALLVMILVVLMILELPIDDESRGQLMDLLGILAAGAIALSSTTLLGNAMAGFMLRSIRNFKAGDFIVVDGHRGRVSELGLLRTEIQTERRNLTTFPNLYLVTNPVTVVRGSGTFISATVSLGYDVPREKVEKCLVEAAEHSGLKDPFVFVLELGDFSITYQAAGFLEDVKYLISAESELRECMLDSLHRAGIEIVSPTFMNQRQVEAKRVFIPEGSRRRRPKPPAPDESRPEERMFDKADLAELMADAQGKLKIVEAELEAIRKASRQEPDPTASQARIEELEVIRETLQGELSRHHETKEKSEDDENES